MKRRKKNEAAKSHTNLKCTFFARLELIDGAT